MTRPVAARRWRGHVGDAAAALLLLALAFALYHEALGLWWQGDDFFQLLFVAEGRPTEYCLDPVVWQRLPSRMLTPLLFLSLDADLGVFGVEPARFYWHQLGALALAALAMLGLLRLWLPTGWALVGASLLLLGPPVASAPALLPVRHYLEGLALALAASGLFVRALRASRTGTGFLLASLSALAWLAASLAKEVYVPLVLLLALLPEGSWATRLRRLLPHAVALAAYLGYRRFLLGEWLGGYGFAPAREDLPRQALALPAALAREMAGAGSTVGVLALLVLAAAVCMAARRRGGALLLVAGALGCLLPVLPVSSAVEPRYAIAAWAGLAIAVPFGLAGWHGGRKVAVVAMVLACAAWSASWRQELARARRAGHEAQALLALPPGDLLRKPSTTPASLGELRRFAPRLLGRRVRAGWFYDDAYLCAHPVSGRLWEYDEGSERLTEIGAERSVLRRATCAALDRQTPLFARFEKEERILRWELGPYRDGTWSFVLGEGAEAFAVPRRGGFHLHRRELTLRVRHEARSGRVAYSPPLRIGLEPGATTSWRRP